VVCNIGRRYALETGSEQGFGIGEAVLTGRTMPHSISPGGPGKPDPDNRLKPTLGLHI